MGLKDSEPMHLDITSAADFKEFIRGRSLYHMRMRRPDVAFERGSANETHDEADVKIGLIISLRAALAAMAVPGTYLELFDAGPLPSNERTASEPAAGTPSASLEPATRVFFVQHAGSKSFVPIEAASDRLVGFVTKDVKKELELSASADRITLQLAAPNKDGVAQLVPLDYAATIAEALAKASTVLGRDIPRAEKLHIVAVERIDRAFLC